MDRISGKLTCLLVLLAYTMGFSQDQDVADSLKALHFDTFSTNDRTEIYIEIAGNSSNPSEIIRYSNMALALARETNNQKHIALSFEHLAQAHRFLGNLDKALNYAFKALKQYQRINYPDGIAVMYNCISAIYLQQKNMEKSIYYLNLSIHINTKNGNRVNLAGDYNNLGETYRVYNNTDSALHYFEKALGIYKSENLDIGIAYTIGNIGLVEASLGNYSTAEKGINQASVILERLGDYYPICVYLISIADILVEKNETEQALSFAMKSLEIASFQGFKEQIKDANLKLSEIYSMNGDFEKAYLFHTQYVSYRDSINNQETIRKMADLRTEYEVSQKQAEVDLLTKQTQLNRIILWSLLFILSLFVILAIILYRNNILRKTTNRLLTSQKEELQVQHRQLESLNNTKDRFFSIISHDLRGPVNAFNGVSELIKHYISKNEMGQLREVSEYIDKSARQLSTLLDNLLDWSVKQQGAFPFHPEKLLLNQLLEEITEMFLMAAHAKKIHFHLTIDEEIEIWADRNSLLTILRNLVNNALKFTGEDGLVTVSAYKQKGYAMINIIDTGVGIPEDKIESIFRLKEREVNRGTSGEKGLGIGLNLASEFADMNNGSILVNSELNAGTIFTVKVPLFEDTENNELIPAQLERAFE